MLRTPWVNHKTYRQIVEGIEATEDVCYILVFHQRFLKTLKIGAILKIVQILNIVEDGRR